MPLAWFWIHRTRRASTCGRSASHPAAADAQGIDVYRLRYAYVVVGGLLAGLAGATITLAIPPGWFGDLTVNGRGWIAIGLVIFAQWNPLRAALGAYLFGAISPFILDLQGVDRRSSASRTRSMPGRSATFFLEMLPYLFVIVVVVIGSREARRKRLGAPAALGMPYVRGERGALTCGP